MDTGAGASNSQLNATLGQELNQNQGLKRSFIEAICAELGRDPTPNSKRPNLRDPPPVEESHVTDLIRVEVSKV